jgi:hypothetical protein
MVAVTHLSGPSSGFARWVELLALGLTIALPVYLLGRASIARLLRGIRRSDTESASTVSAIVASAVAEDDPEVVVMRATYELRRLLQLDDCRWAWLGDPLPVATLEDDGTICYGSYRWPHEEQGLPSRGVSRRLSAGGASYGWIVLVPALGAPLSDARLRSAVTTIDVLALCLDQHHHPAVPGPTF